MRNWDIIDTISLMYFATGTISGSEFYQAYKNTKYGGAVRNLLRENGTDNARRLAKRALQRRTKKEKVCVV